MPKNVRRPDNNNKEIIREAKESNDNTKVLIGGISQLTENLKILSSDVKNINVILKGNVENLKAVDNKNKFDSNLINNISNLKNVGEGVIKFSYNMRLASIMLDSDSVKHGVKTLSDLVGYFSNTEKTVTLSNGAKIHTINNINMTGVQTLVTLGKDITKFGMWMRLASYTLDKDTTKNVAQNISNFIKIFDTNSFIAEIRDGDEVIKESTIKGLNAESIKNLDNLLKLSDGIFEFGKSVAKYGFISNRANKGVIGFSNTISMLMSIFDTDVNNINENLTGFDKVGSDIADSIFGKTKKSKVSTVSKENIERNSKLILLLTNTGKSIFEFGKSLALYNLVAVPAMTGAVLFGGTVKVLSQILNIRADKENENSLKSLDMINKLGLGVVSFGVGLALYNLVAVPALTGAVLFGTTIGILSTILHGFNKKFNLSDESSMDKMTKGLGSLSLAILGFSASFAIISTFLNWDSILLGSAVLGLVSLSALSFSLIGKIGLEKASVGMNLMGASLIVISGGIWALTQVVTNIGLKEAGIALGMITVLGLGYALVGKVSPFIIAGSIAIGSVGLSLIAISAGIELFRRTGWDGNKDSKKLKNTIHGIYDGFLGGYSEYDPNAGKGNLIMDGIKFAGRSLALIISGFSLMIASGSLVITAGALSLVQSMNFNPSSIGNLKIAIDGIYEAFLGKSNLDTNSTKDNNLSTVLTKMGLSFVSGLAFVGRNALLLMSSVSIMAASGSLILTAKALKTAGNIGFNPDKMNTLKTTIDNIYDAFGAGKNKTFDTSKGNWLTKAGKFLGNLGVGFLKNVSLAGRNLVLMTSVVTIGGAAFALKNIAKVVKQVNDGKFENASANIKLILHSLYDGFTLDKNQQKSLIETTDVIIPLINGSLGDAINVVERWDKINGIKASENINNFYTGISKGFDPKFNKEIIKTSEFFTGYTNNILKIADKQKEVKEFAKNVDNIQKSMRLFKTHINAMDLEKLTLTDSLMESLAILAKNPEVIAQTVSDSINESFDRLVELLETVVRDNSNSLDEFNSQFANLQLSGNTQPQTQQIINQTNQPQTQQSQISTDSIIEAFRRALIETTVKVNLTQVAHGASIRVLE